MGARARRRAADRERLRQHRRETARLHAEAEAMPEFAAELAAATDDEVIALARAEVFEQERRLKAAGWVCTRAGTDGCGVWDHRRSLLRIIHSVARERDGRVWAHTSVSDAENRAPDWPTVRDCFRLLYPARTGIIVVPPADEHVDIAEVFHVWACLDGGVLPDFRHLGQI